MDKNNLKELSKSKLIKLLLKPIIKIVDTELMLFRESALSKSGIESDLKKKTKSQLIKLLIEKDKNKPEMKCNFEEKTYEINEHIPDSNISITYGGEFIACERELIVCEGDSKINLII